MLSEEPCGNTTRFQAAEDIDAWRWPPLFGAADMHHPIACLYGLCQLSMVWTPSA